MQVYMGVFYLVLLHHWNCSQVCVFNWWNKSEFMFTIIVIMGGVDHKYVSELLLSALVPSSITSRHPISNQGVRQAGIF